MSSVKRSTTILYENAEKINMSDLIDKLLDDHLDGEGDSDSDDDGDEKDGRGKET
jgi:hypothetical protein